MKYISVLSCDITGLLTQIGCSGFSHSRSTINLFDNNFDVKLLGVLSQITWACKSIPNLSQLFPRVFTMKREAADCDKVKESDWGEQFGKLSKWYHMALPWHNIPHAVIFFQVSRITYPGREGKVSLRTKKKKKNLRELDLLILYQQEQSTSHGKETNNIV